MHLSHLTLAMTVAIAGSESPLKLLAPVRMETDNPRLIRLNQRYRLSEWFARRIGCQSSRVHWQAEDAENYGNAMASHVLPRHYDFRCLKR